MQSFTEIVMGESYIAELRSKKTPKSPEDIPTFSKAISMDDLVPKQKRNVVKQNESNSQWLNTWSLENSDIAGPTSPVTTNVNYTPTEVQQQKMINLNQTNDSSSNLNGESFGFTDPPEEISPSTSSRSSTRTRENTANSLSFVKITKSVSKFEDLKSEAMNSWTEGVDIELDSDSKAEKKTRWLSLNAFMANDIRQQKKEQQRTSMIEVNHDQPAINEIKQRTYAEAPDNTTPAWAEHNDIQPNSTPQKTTSGFWSSNDTQPSRVVPPVYIPMVTPSPKDTYLLRFLYASSSKSNSRQAFQTLKQKIDGILHQNLQEITFRTFSFLLDALTELIEYENQHSETDTVRKIHNIWPTFNSYLIRFLQNYVHIPPDLVSVLRFLNIVVSFFHEIYKELPQADILRIYDEMKNLDVDHNVLKLLRQLHMLPESEKWSSTEDLLPKVPTAEIIITEVIQKVNVLEEYEAKTNLSMTNATHEPWADMNLVRYMLVHFMLLRDEVVGPIQRIVKELFKGKPLSNIHVPECAIYEKTSPISTTFMISSSESCIVFALGAVRPNDQLMEDMTEGSLVVLLSEDIQSQESRLNSKKKVAELSMVGHIVRASSSYSQKGDMVRMVSVHINKNEISKIDWNGHYTMIVTKLNAPSTMSIISWLHEQSVEVDKKRLSWVLTPRILGANNVLSQEQLNCLDGDFYEQLIATNKDPVPIYLQGEVDMSPVLVKNANRIAQPALNAWPDLPAKWNSVSPSKRPALYTLSPSQLNAFKFALTHRVAVISGASGTGKTHLASKLALVLNEALHAGQFHQPILVVTKSQSTLDQILSSIVRHIPDIIRFGCEPYIESLLSKQATKLAAPSVSDSNYRQYQSIEHKMAKNQSRLAALFKARYQAKNHDPLVFSSMVPPAFLSALSRGYQSGQHEAYHPPLAIWNIWARDDNLTRNYRADSFETQSHAQWVLENAYLKHSGHKLMPIIDPNTIRNRFGWVANNPSQVLSISDATNWPFDTSRRTGNELRTTLMNTWRQVSTDQVWYMSKHEKTGLIKKLSHVLLSFIDSEIEDLIQAQIKLSESFDDILIGKLTYLCRFNRIIGMTSDFAAAHREWVSTLWPRAVIVDEASDMLESTLVSSLLGPRTEHIILLGTSDNANRPRLINPLLTNRYLDVSLFERWKNTANEFALLEEQWYMHSQVADVVDKFNSIKLETSSLLITAPMASCSENMVDRRFINNESLYGINQRAFYLQYNNEITDDIHEGYSRALKTTITQSEVDEARFVAFFAVYLSQQPYHTTSITVLTLTLLQKYLIRSILRDEVPKRTHFKSQVAKINLDVVEQYMGRHDNFVIVSTATPGYSSSSYDNLSGALTRARYGLFVVGKPHKDKVHDRWNDFARYMEERELLGPAIQLTCHVHGDTIFAGHWTDFDKMKNGGCQRTCDTLMSDGHVCKEDCHFLSHEEIVCQEPCIRLRPSNCTHACQRKCYECSKAGSCPPCTVQSQIELPCGHIYKDMCHKLLHINHIKCQEPTDVELPCGHTESVPCCQSHDISKITCKKHTKVTLECGHTVTQTCGVDVVCTEMCSKPLECGHQCLEICGVQHSHERSQCGASCPKQLICGHQCAKGCANPDDHTERCIERCNYICSHEYKCGRECWKDCIRCVSECPYKCEHYKCSKKCYEICDRPPCNAPCKKKFGCLHQCSGLCGEPCPPCKICNPDLKCSISLRTLSEFENDEKVYMLPECGCVYSVESLDMYFENQAKNGEHVAVRLWDCPTCKKTIYTALRYNRYIKTEIASVNEIKLRLEQERQRLTHHEVEQIITAMNNETKSHAIHNIVGGRWFVCPNKHPYYVGDCGGATEISKCPECDALIGGVEHRVVESNRFYGEFDGSEKPAWPGQPGANE